MKVFLLKKDEEDETYRTYEKKSIIHIKREEKFNCIIIQNRCDSNRICTIQNIKVDNKKVIDSVGIYEGKNICNKYKGESDTVDIFDIYSDFQIQTDACMLQLIKNKVNNDKENNVLDDLMLIVIPKGCLFIKLNQAIFDFRVNIRWTAEKIFK